MRTFLNHIKNETLDEIKTSLENLWQQMIQLSEFFQYSFVLILKRKCLVRAGRVRSGESGTPSTIIYVRWSSRRYELGCDTPVVWAWLGLGYPDSMPWCSSIVCPNWICMLRAHNSFVAECTFGTYNWGTWGPSRYPKPDQQDPIMSLTM